MEGLLAFALIGLVVGWLAGVLVKGGGFGILGDIAVGVLGAVLGGYLFSALSASSGVLLGEIIIAAAGAMILIFLMRRIKRI